MIKIIIADCPFCKAKAEAYFEDKKLDHWMRHKKNCWLVINNIHEAADRIQTFTQSEDLTQWNDLLNTEGPDLSIFAETFSKVAEDVHQNAIKKGWWENDRNDGELISLMHAELSEALEALRAGNPPDNHIPEFNGIETELADVIIRIMDYAGARSYRVGQAIEAKINYNKGRSYKHGNKKF